MTRRTFLGGAIVLVAAAPLAACGGDGTSTAGGDAGDGGGAAKDGGGTPVADAAGDVVDLELPGGGDAGGVPDADAGPASDAGADATEGPRWTVPPGATLDAARYTLLLATMDALIPGDAASPGATEASAAWYLDQLLGAFSVDPPRIYAGGPYSGRHGGLDGFSTFQPLTRVEAIRWRTFIEGSQGLPEREWNGPVRGLRQRYEEGLDAIDALCQAKNGRSFAALDLDERRGFLSGTDAIFVQLVFEHAVEGTYGDPVYGGNTGMSGWKAIDYEGDRQPIGYTARQMSHPEEG